MRKQVSYNFSKLIGDTGIKQKQMNNPNKKLSKFSKDKNSVNNSLRNLHSQIRPLGIYKIRNNETSSSKSSIHSIQKKQLKVSAKPSIQKSDKQQKITSEDFFNNFDQKYLIKYNTMKYQHKSVKRQLFKQFEKESGNNYRQSFFNPQNKQAFKSNEPRYSLSSSCSNSKERLHTYKSQNKLTMKQIQIKYKQSQQKIRKIRQKVNQLYHMNTQSSNKDFRSIVIKPKSKVKQYNPLYL